MSNKLTKEEEDFVKLARKLAEERAKQTPDQQVPMNPDKFGGAIGLDDNGDVVPGQPELPPAPPTPPERKR